jgi:uncharacterized repeat protein (TIGR01451 family)
LLTFTNGRLITGANKVIMSSGASVSGASAATGWVAGNMQKFIAAGASTTTFEVGTIGAAAPALAYTPITTAFTGVAAGGGNLLAFSSVGEHPQIATSGLVSSKSINRVYTLTAAGVSGTALPAFTSYDATFTYVSSDADVGINTANVIVNRWTGSAWSPPTGVGTRTSTSAQATGIPSLGGFALGEPIALELNTLSAVISDPTNGTVNPKRSPGAIIEYTFTATNSAQAAATVSNVVISDTIPSGMTYLPGSLLLDGTPEDDDSVNGGTSNPDLGNYNSSLTRVTGNVGSISPNASKTLKFRVTVN